MTYDDGESFAANDPPPQAHWSQILDFVVRVVRIRQLQGAERRAAVVALLRDIYGPDVVSI